MKVIDFFCGMGGASLGYIDAGHEIVLAIDNWVDALTTHEHNLPKVPILNCDINTLPLDALPYADIYHLSPPCQSFSTAGKQSGFNSINGNLFFKSIEILKCKRPNIFVIENVKGLLKHIEKYSQIFIGFEEYQITKLLVNAKDCGVCQSRERVFIVGVNKAFGKFERPSEIDNKQTFDAVIERINKTGNWGVPKHSNSLVEKIKYIPQGGNVMNIPENIRPKSFKNSYSRLCVDKMPPTITRNYNCPSSANCIHPYEDRGLSDAEALFIQGFPEWWRVLGRSKNLQIGNAVPPPMISWLMSGIHRYNIKESDMN